MVKVRHVGKYLATQKTGENNSVIEKPIKITNWSQRRDRASAAISVPKMKPVVHPNTRSWYLTKLVHTATS